MYTSQRMHYDVTKLSNVQLTFLLQANVILQYRLAIKLPASNYICFVYIARDNIMILVKQRSALQGPRWRSGYCN